MAHELAIPVVGGGRALGSGSRAARLGFDAFARVPADVAEILRTWQSGAPELATAPPAIPEHDALHTHGRTLVAAALATTEGPALPSPALFDELQRVVLAVEAALLVAEPSLIDDHVGWLRETGPRHGLPLGMIDAALVALADQMNEGLERPGRTLRAALD
jgi:hypothetical protein